MAETSESQEAKGQRIFISYSRADRQRVEGLASLLEALAHDVFMDQRSIRPGQRWKKRLEEELRAADVLLVFWTRHAARSTWVRQEYESFESQFPDRTLVPVIGDLTPLTERLQAHQHSDFCPLINELLATVHDLEEKGVGKRGIRAAVLKRLEEEGIELPSDKRNRLFALFGFSGLLMTPLYLLNLGTDLLIDRVSAIPASYYYTAGVAAAAGLFTCHTLLLGGDRDTSAGSLLAPDLFPVAIVVGQSGSRACETQDMICVSVSRSEIIDPTKKFFGYSTPTCSANVARLSYCQTDFDTDFAMKGVVVRRSPEADEGVEDLTRFDYFCLSDDKGKQGIYEFANCVKP